MHFHVLIQGTTSAGVQSFVMVPANWSSRASAEATSWEYFRCDSIRFRTFSAGTPLAIGFAPGVPVTAPATILTVMELMDSVHHLGFTGSSVAAETMWSRWVKVSKPTCGGAYPWYKTVVGSEAAQIEAPQTLVVAGSGAQAWNMEVYFTLTFKGQINSADTPLGRELHARLQKETQDKIAEKEKSALLRLLSFNPNPGGPGDGPTRTLQGGKT
jgi:hypothetical protein